MQTQVLLTAKAMLLTTYWTVPLSDKTPQLSGTRPTASGLPAKALGPPVNYIRDYLHSQYFFSKTSKSLLLNTLQSSVQNRGTYGDWAEG